MSTVNGFQVGSEVLKYNYESLENYNTPEFSSSSSKIYNVGDYVTHSGKLYKCKTATTGGTWNSAEWETAVLTDDVVGLNSALTETENAVFGTVDNTFPLVFENGTYYYTANGKQLEKYYGGGYDLTRKVVKSTVFNAPCIVSITAKTGYSFTVFTSENGVITGNSGLVTEYTMISGQQYGITLRTTGGSDNISATPVSSIVDIEYISNVDEINSTCEILTDNIYSKVRPSSNADGNYTIRAGYYSGSIGGRVYNSSTSSLIACTDARIPMDYKANISIQNSAVYNMSVFVCTRSSPATILSISNLSNHDVFVDPAVNANGVAIGVNFSRQDGATLTSSDLTTLAELFRIYYTELEIIKDEFYKSTTIVMPLELGTVPTSYDLNDNSTIYAAFYKRMRTPHFLDIRRCSSFVVDSVFDLITVGFYNAAYEFVTSQSITSNTPVSVPKNACFCRFIVRKSDDTNFDYYKDTITVTCSGMANMLKAIGRSANNGNIVMCYVVPGQTGMDQSNTTMQAPDIVDTTGILRLPPNYSNDGEAVPLIVYAHGSDDYSDKWQTEIRGRIGHKEVITYLVNEGFAVFDSFGHSSAVTFSSGAYPHTYGSLDCMNCYVAGIRRVLDVYNISKDGIYVTGISSGGLAALNFAFDNTIPVLACAPFAPVVTPYGRWLGYNEQQRKEFAWAQGFVGDYDVLNGANSAAPNTTSIPEYSADLVEFYTDNASRVIGYNPMWNGVVGTPFSTLVSWALQRSESNTRLSGGDKDPANWANVYRICKTPIKIWIADDDENVTPAITYNFIQSLKNGQCIAELRIVPDGQGGHYAFTSSETTERTSGKTALGIAYTDIPIYWVEMIAFFRSF